MNFPYVARIVLVYTELQFYLHLLYVITRTSYMRHLMPTHLLKYRFSGENVPHKCYLGREKKEA